MLGSSGWAEGRECWGPVGGHRVESAGGPVGGHRVESAGGPVGGHRVESAGVQWVGRG